MISRRPGARRDSRARIREHEVVKDLSGIGGYGVAKARYSGGAVNPSVARKTSRSALLKIRDRFALAAVEACFDLDYEDVAAPAVFDGGFGVPEAFLAVLD